MTEPKIDPQRLAALLDGRLNAQERAEVLAQLAESPADLETFADSAAVLSELSREEVAGVVPLPAESKRVLTRWQWGALAAAVAVLAVAPWAWRRATTDRTADPGRYATLVSSVDGSTSPWNSYAWTRTRGGEEILPSDVRAARIGVLISDIEISLDRRDARGPQLVSEVAGLLETYPGGAATAEAYRSAYSGGERQTRDARVAAARLVGADMVHFAAWSEAARAAAAKRDTRFFQSAESREIGERVRTITSGNESVRRAFALVQQRIGPTSTPNSWPELERALEQLLGELTS